MSPTRPRLDLRLLDKIRAMREAEELGPGVTKRVVRAVKAGIFGKPLPEYVVQRAGLHLHAACRGAHGV